MTWMDAEADCKTRGGHLADVKGENYNVRVWDACTSDRCWVGLNDLSTGACVSCAPVTEVCTSD